jgi:hypothetical protein
MTISEESGTLSLPFVIDGTAVTHFLDSSNLRLWLHI